MSKVAIVVQASLVSWEGGADICANEWGGRLVVEHTLERVINYLPDSPVWILAPDIPENEPLNDIALKNGVDIIFGPFNDVVARYCLMPDRVEHVLRVIGMHPFFSPHIARDLIRTCDSEPDLDVILPPEDVDGQFVTEIFSLDTLRKLNRDMSLEKLRSDPARFLCAHGARKRILDNNMYDTTSDREKLRELATHVYKEDVLHADQRRIDQGYTDNSQIFGHYRLGFDFSRQHSKKTVKTILDIGGALGFRKTLQKTSDIRLDYHVVDIDPDKVAEGKKKDSETKFVCGNCYDLPFNDNFFNLIFACEIIEHVDQPKKLLEEALRVVKSGGYLAISTPQNRSGETPLNPHHLFEFTMSDFSSICDSFNIEVSYFTFHSGINYVDGLSVGNNMMAIFCKH